MDNPVTLRFKGEDRPLNYSIEVMFDAVEKYGNITVALEKLEGHDAEAFDAVRWFAAKLINDGELCRREEGQDRLPMVKEKDLSPRMRPADFETIRAAVIAAITRGYRREITAEDEERDLGLEELESKKQEAGESEPSTTTLP